MSPNREHAEIEPMPEGAPVRRELPDGSSAFALHINHGPLPEDPAERAMEVARRSALRAEMTANARAMGLRTRPAPSEMPDTFLTRLRGRLAYVGRLFAGRA